MSKKSSTENRAKLRKDAEARFARDPKARAPSQSPAALLHELQVHQIELEMQNEELRRDHLELEVAHERYVDLYDFAPVGYVTLDPRGCIETANLTAATLLGEERKRLVGRPFARYVDGPDANRWNLLLEASLQESGKRSCSLALRRGNGATFQARVSCDGLAPGPSARLAFTDISDLLESETRLRMRESLLEAILEGTTDGILVVDDGGRVLRINRRFQELWRLPDHVVATQDDGALLRHVTDQLADPPAFHREVERLYASGETSTDHVELADGRVFERFTSPFPFGGPRGRLWSFRDITEQRKAERALRDLSARLSRVVEGSTDGSWDSDVRTGRVDFSPRYAAMLGYDHDELEPDIRTLAALIHPDDAESAMAALLPIMRGETDYYVAERRLHHKDGHWVWTLSRGKVVERNAEGHAVRMAGTCTDITERKAAESALRESEARFRLLASATAFGVFQTGATGQILFVNPTYLALTGLTEAEAHGPDGWKAIHPDDRERVLREWQEALSDGAPFASEYRHHLPDGTVNWVRMVGTPIRDDAGAVSGYVGAMADITESRALQAQLALSSRLAAMGTLVTGVAHEINNPLAAELANQGMALEVVREVRARLAADPSTAWKAEVGQLDDVVEALEDAQEGGERIARIVKDLAMFGRPDAKRTRVRVIDVVNETLRWLPTALAPASSFRVEDGAPPDVVASPGLIEQVLLNLLTNAAWATPEGTNQPILVRLGPGKPGMARIEIVDRGRGIAPAVLERIFDPFFTTHPVGAGKGMGLGLAISLAIVNAHGGTLTVESAIGKGSTFRVELPAAPAET